MKKYQFSCGCCFPYNEEKKTIVFDPNIETLNLECQKTWELIGEGNTKGVFQLESRLGKTTAKKLKPENMEQLSALIAILRPGSLESIRDNKSITTHYIDRKNGEEGVSFFHPSLEPILKTTYGEMIYQEQSMEIARIVAGFDLKDADMLRKAIGKKKPEEMAKVKVKFLDGARRVGLVTEEEALEIFSWIEKSQRYQFNKSHSVSYGINAYLSAYCKAHFPKVFFASYLRFAKDKMDPQAEIKELILNAMQMDIRVKIPDLRIRNARFEIHNGDIIFGLLDIKGVGESAFKKLNTIIVENNFDLYNIDWLTLLLKVLLHINSKCAKAFIESGAVSFLGKSRSSMIYEFNIASELTDKELEFIFEQRGNFKNLGEGIDYLLKNGKITKTRRQVIENLYNALIKPPHSLTDTIEYIAGLEESNLGCSVSCSKVDYYDVSMTNLTCQAFNSEFVPKDIVLAGEIDNFSVTKTKNGKNPGQEMCFLRLIDGTGVVDSAILFPETFQEFRHLLFEGNIIVVKGYRSKTKDSLIVQKVFLAQT